MSLMNGGLIVSSCSQLKYVNYHFGCRYCLEAFSMDGEFLIGNFVSSCPHAFILFVTYRQINNLIVIKPKSNNANH
jgi:hypothetical protein